MKTIDPLTTDAGDKIIFAYPTNGYPHDQDRALMSLVLGKEYTVKYVVVGDWCSSVYLEEVSGASFNSVLFGVRDEEDKKTDEPEYLISDGKGGVVNLNDASTDQMKAEIKRLINLTEYVDTHISVIASTIDTWRNKK